MKAVQYSHQGKRDNQEDAYGLENDKFFVVCDGVGGHEKGEVASNFVVDYVKSHFTELEVVNKISLQELIVNAQLAINQQLVETPEANGMGTTFAGVFRGDDAFYIVHLGDSRIYWVKPRSKQIWHTWDHSMVGNLMQMGEITREEGRFHPNGNRISKAIIANAEGKTSKPDISKITQVDAGDLFLICSDGVTEAWSEYELVEVLCDSQKTVEQKLASIQERCAQQSKDNNTAILLEVDTQLALNGADNEEISWLTLDFFRSDYEAYHNPQTVEIEAEITAEEPIELELVHESPTEQIPLPPMTDQSNDTKKKVFMAIVLIIIALIAAFFIKKMNNAAETNGDGLLILAKENQLYGFQNSNKEWVIPARFIAAEPFEDGRAKVTTADSIFYIDEQGQMIAFVGLVGEDDGPQVQQGTTDSPNKPNSTGSNDALVNNATGSQSQSTAPNQTGALLQNNLNNSSSSASFESDAQIENAYKKLVAKYAKAKIPAVEEKKFLDRIENSVLRESYRKKIANHNSLILTQPSVPSIPAPSSPTPTEPDPESDNK
jgi:protein phosphatase